MAGGNPDVKLLFGAEQGSYGQISHDLEQIIEKINSENKFAIKISKIDLDNSAVEDFKQKLSAIVKSLQVGDGVNVGITAGGTGDVGAGMKQAASAAQTAAKETANLRQQIQAAANTAAHMNFGAAVDTVTTLKNRLSGLKVDPGAIDQMATQLDDMHVSVEQISAQWEINEKTQERLLRTTISGTDAQKRQLSLVQTYNAKTGDVSTTVANVTANFKKQAAEAQKSATEVEKINQAMRSMGSKIEQIKQASSQISGPHDALSTSVAEIDALMDAYNGMDDPNDKAKAYAALKKEIEFCAKEMANLRSVENTNNKAAAEVEKINQAMRSMDAQIASIKASFSRLSNPSNGLKTSIGTLDESVEKVKKATPEKKAEAYADLQKEIAYCRRELAALNGIEDSTAQLDKVSAAIKTTRGLLDKWSAAAHGSPEISGAYGNLKKSLESLEDLEYSLSSAKAPMQDFGEKYSKIIDDISRARSIIQGSGKDVQSFGDRFMEAAKKFSSWLSVSQVIMTLVRSIKKMVTAVVEIDTAMTELRKVTDETESTYTRFLVNATKRAKQLGAAVSDVVAASADFARLGYSLDEAAELADAAIVYKNVGDGIADISEASESIISTMKAFGVEADNAMSIVDKFNKVGNEFPISSQGIGEALTRSAAAMHSAGNSLEESIALITAANAIVQDPDSVGTTMKTVSMYLRAAKTEAEEAGESTDGMANSVSELRSEILALTGNRVDIQIDEDNFKSTYAILKELAGVWDNLTDITQANVLEMIGGKRNANVVAALMENFETVEDVVKSASNAEGSALEENEKYLESIQGHISEFKAEFEELSTTVVNSEIVKLVVDAGTGLATVVNGLTDINAILPAILTTVVAINAVRRAQTAERISQQAIEATATTAAKLLSEKKATDALVGSYLSLGSAYQQIVLHRITNAALSGKITEQTKDEIIKTLELAAAEKSAAVSGEALTKSSLGLSSVLGAVSPVGWALTALSLLPMLISLFQEIGQENDELIQRADDIKAAYDESLSSAADSLETLHGLTDEFNELSKGVGNNGENISLAADDYQRYQEIISTITDITPSLISGYDAEGNAIANKNGLLEKSIELMEEEQRLKKQELVSENNITDIGLGAKAALVDYQTEYRSDLGAKADFAGAFHKALHGKDLTDVYDILGATEWENWDDNVFKIGNRANGFAMVYYEQIVQALRQNRHILSDYLSEVDVDNLLAFADEYDRDVEVYNARVEEYSKALNPTLQYVPQTLTAYSEFSDAQKEFLTSYINSFRITAETTEEDIKQMKRDILAFTDFVAENGDMDDTIRIGMSIKYGTDDNGNSLSVDEYHALIEQFLNQISRYDAETQVRIKAAFGIETDDDQINEDAEKAIAHVGNILSGSDAEIEAALGDLTLDEVLQIYYNISAAPNSMTMDELLQKLDELKAASASTAASSLINTAAPIQENVSALSDALDDFKESGSLSGSALSELTEVFGALPSFDAAANTLASTSTTAAEAKVALEQLAKEYLESGNTVGSILDQLTEDNKELTIAMLEQMGVANASQLVMRKLDQIAAQNALDTVTEETKDATIALLKQAGAVNAEEAVFKKLNVEAFRAQLAQAGITDYASEAADSLAAESEDAAAAALALKALRLESIRAKIASTDLAAATASDIDALLKEATAAGYASRSLQMLYTIKLSVQNHGKYTQGMTGSEIKEYIEKLQSDINKDLNDTDLSLDFGNIDFNIDITGLGSGGSTSALEKYTADIDEFREALERLNRIQLNKELLELDLSHTDDLTEQIRLERDLANVYEHEAQVVKELIGLRTTSIQDKIDTLRQRGFDIEYNAEKNWLYVRNLEHINELQKDGTEATNEYRQETEELIEAVEELNEENQEAISTWKELEYSIREAKAKVIENLKAIVSETSEAIDSIQSVYDALKEAADEYAANDGFISVDAYQKIVELGPQYMQYLRDENGLLVINEENINKVIAAKTQQLALEQAMTYVERLRLALNDDSIEDLNNLLYATVETTNATWGLVYANLALLNLSDSQRAAALHNINAIRAMADNAIEGIGRTPGSALEALNDMKSGLDDILEYVMDMLRDEVERQIDALEDEKDAYADLIDLKKKSLEETEKETDYQDEVAAKIKEIAKLQERINALSLDNSRDAQAKKIALEEEMAELQKELADYQADYAMDAQQDSLDQMQEAYEKEKDNEIDALEDSISSQQKLYSKSIEYIQNNWSSLYDDLISWNTEYGSVLNDEITTAWDNCLAAAQRYGSYVNALNSIDADIESASGESSNVVIGSTNYDSSYGNDEMVHAIIKQMYENMNEHGGSGSSTSVERKKQLSAENLALGEQLHAYGINAYRDEQGTWWTDPSMTKKLFDVYKQYTYHTGGIAGNNPTAKQNEIFAKLEEGEAIFNDKHQAALWKILTFTSELGERFKSVMSETNFSSIFRNMQGDNLTPAKTETTQQTSIHFGDVYVYGGNEKTVEAHREVNRQFANEVLKQLNIKR